MVCESTIMMSVRAAKRGATTPYTDNEVKDLISLCQALLKGAAKCTEAPHYIVQPFLGIVRDHSDVINKLGLFEGGISNDQVLSSIDTWSQENQSLRELLWLHHGHDSLYGDDGEMQCSRCGLDFKRDNVDNIKGKLSLRLKELMPRPAGSK